MNTRPEEKLLKISKNFPLLSQLKIHRIHNIYIYIFPPLSAITSTKGQSLQIHHMCSHVGSKAHHLIFYTCAHFFFFSIHPQFSLRSGQSQEKGTIFYVIQNQAYTDTITFYYSPKPQISKPVQNRTQESSFTLNATQGTKKNK